MPRPPEHGCPGLYSCASRSLRLKFQDLRAPRTAPQDPFSLGPRRRLWTVASPFVAESDKTRPEAWTERPPGTRERSELQARPQVARGDSPRSAVCIRTSENLLRSGALERKELDNVPALTEAGSRLDRGPAFFPAAESPCRRVRQFFSRERIGTRASRGAGRRRGERYNPAPWLPERNEPDLWRRRNPQRRTREPPSSGRAGPLRMPW